MMKKFNILYLVVIAAAFFIWKMSNQSQNQTVMFYGFAENKETEINLEHAVQVNQIFVTTGQQVEKGTPLLEASHNKLPLKLNDINYAKEEIKIERLQWRKEIEADIDELKMKRAVGVSEVQGKIAQIKAKITQNQSLLKDIDGLEGANKVSTSTQAKLDALNKEMEMVTQPLDAEINRLEKKLKANATTFNLKLQKLKSEEAFYEDKGRKLHIFAPSAGLVGNIHCKEAENISSFKTLITFYEENPTLVKGYVHEKLVLHVQVGDTIQVSSSMHDKSTCVGVVTGLGSRIVEIPERLRKHKDLKDYGREVLIKIPADNEFLQKEKVLLKIDKQVKVADNFYELVNEKEAKSKANISKQFDTE